MREETVEIAEEIVADELAELLNQFAQTKDTNKSKELKDKIDVLQQIKGEIYSGNKEVINMIIRKRKNGVL